MILGLITLSVSSNTDYYFYIKKVTAGKHTGFENRSWGSHYSESETQVIQNYRT